MSGNLYVRVVDGEVKDCWDTVPAEGVGNNGWMNAVEFVQKLLLIVKVIRHTLLIQQKIQWKVYMAHLTFLLQTDKMVWLKVLNSNSNNMPVHNY